MKSITFALLALSISSSAFATTYNRWDDSRASMFGNTGFANACVSLDGKSLKSITAAQSLSCKTVRTGGQDGGEDTNCSVVSNDVTIPLTSQIKTCVTNPGRIGHDGGQPDCTFKTVTSKIATTQVFEVYEVTRQGGGQDSPQSEELLVGTGSYVIPACLK